MKQFPDHDVMEHRIRQMAESLEPPVSLSPDRMLLKLPDRPAAGRLTLARKYAPAVAMAACLLVVLAGTAALRGFTGEPVIQPDSSLSADPEPSAQQPSSEPAEESRPADAASPNAKEPAQEDETPEAAPPSNALPGSAPPESAPSDSAAKREPENAARQPEPDEQPAADNTVSAPAPPAAGAAGEDASAAESTETPEPSPDGPPGAKDLSFLALQAGETFESYRDVYSAMENARRAVEKAGQTNDAPLILAAMKAPSVSAVTQNVEAGGEVVTNNKALCAISPNMEEPSVLIYTPDGKNTALTAELKPSFFLPDLEGMHVNYLSISQLLLEDDTLIIAGKAYYWANRTNEQQSLSVFSFYDISDPANPAYLSTLCQDGDLSAAYLNNGALCFITRYTVPAGRELTEENLSSYLPYAYDNGQAIIPRRSQILLSEEAAEPVYTSLSTVDLSDVTNFADTYCYFGGISGLLVNDQFVCLMNTRTDPDQLILHSFELTGSGIEQCGEATLDGALCGEAFLLPKSRGLAVTLQDGEGNPSLYLLDKKMQAQGTLAHFAPAASIAAVQYDGTLAYFLNGAGTIVATADCSAIRSPKLLRQNPDALPSAVQSVSFGSYSLRMDYLLDESGMISGVTVGMYDASGLTLLHSTEVTGDLYVPAMYDSAAFFADERSGLIGFALTRYGSEENGYASSYSYLLFQYNETGGFRLLAELPLGSGTDGGISEYQTGILSRGTFYVVLSDRVLAVNPQSGKLLAETSGIQ